MRSSRFAAKNGGVQVCVCQGRSEPNARRASFSVKTHLKPTPDVIIVYYLNVRPST